MLGHLSNLVNYGCVGEQLIFAFTDHHFLATAGAVPKHSALADMAQQCVLAKTAKGSIV